MRVIHITVFHSTRPTQSQYKCYSSEREGLPITSVAALKGKYPGSQAYHKVTPHNTPHTRYLLGKTREWQKTGFIYGSLGAEFSRVEISRMRIGRISSPQLGTSSGIGWFSSSLTGVFSTPEVSSDIYSTVNSGKTTIKKRRMSTGSHP